jgi:dihydrofolate reductase
MVMTLDGVIAKNSGHDPTEWSSAEDKKLYRETTKAWGVMIMGQSTYDAIGQPLPGRLNIVLTKQPRDDQPGILEHKQGDLKKILDDLEARNYSRAMICGGTMVNSQFLAAGLIDEIQITIEPKIFGQGLRLFDQIDADLNLELLEIKKLNASTINLLYKVKKN